MDKYINNFLDDDEKILDFFSISKEEFLTTYSYVPEEEYDRTAEIISKLTGYILLQNQKYGKLLTHIKQEASSKKDIYKTQANEIADRIAKRNFATQKEFNNFASLTEAALCYENIEESIQNAMRSYLTATQALKKFVK